MKHMKMNGNQNMQDNHKVNFKLSPILFVFGFVLALGGVGSIEQAETTRAMFLPVMSSITGLLFMLTAVLTKND